MEDREIIAWFLLDLSPSVDFGTLDTQKRTILVDFVGVLSRLLTRHGNRVGAVMFGSGVQHTVPARGGRMHVLRLINDLLKQPHLNHVPMTDLSALIRGGLHSIKKRSLVFVVSDFISTPGWERTLGLLAQRHEVIAIRLWDPRETTLPDVGHIVLEDMETGEQLFVDTSDKKFRQRFMDAAQKREEALTESFKHAGVDVLQLSTEADLIHSIASFVMLRRQRRK
jgi:uncharacterized protein (DUF58 family)